MTKILDKFTKDGLVIAGGPASVMGASVVAIRNSAQKLDAALANINRGSAAVPILIKEHIRRIEDELEMYESAAVLLFEDWRS